MGKPQRRELEEGETLQKVEIARGKYARGFLKSKQTGIFALKVTTRKDRSLSGGRWTDDRMD